MCYSGEGSRTIKSTHRAAIIDSLQLPELLERRANYLSLMVPDDSCSHWYDRWMSVVKNGAKPSPWSESRLLFTLDHSCRSNWKPVWVWKEVLCAPEEAIAVVGFTHYGLIRIGISRPTRTVGLKTHVSYHLFSGPNIFPLQFTCVCTHPRSQVIYLQYDSILWQCNLAPPSHGCGLHVHPVELTEIPLSWTLTNRITHSSIMKPSATIVDHLGPNPQFYAAAAHMLLRWNLSDPTAAPKILLLQVSSLPTIRSAGLSSIVIDSGYNLVVYDTKTEQKITPGFERRWTSSLGEVVDGYVAIRYCSLSLRRQTSLQGQDVRINQLDVDLESSLLDYVDDIVHDIFPSPSPVVALDISLGLVAHCYSREIHLININTALPKRLAKLSSTLSCPPHSLILHPHFVIEGDENSLGIHF